MKRILIALAVAGAFLLPAAPVVAQAQVSPDLGILILTAKGLGIKFKYDGPACAANPRLMGFFTPHEGSVTICFKNANKGGVSPLQVLRHELLHAAQQCAGGPLLKRDYSSPVDLAADYPADQHRTETEARVLADELSELDVARTLAVACSNAT
jgi:hypothetical protein